MKLIALKPCSFGGKKFYIGDEIPAEFVLDPQAQEKRGVLAIVPDGTEEAPPAAPEDTRNEVDTMTVVIHAKEGDIHLALTKEGLQNVVDVLTSKPADAVKIIGEMTDGDALILAHITDSRKTVKEAAEERAKGINSEESAGDQ